MAINLVVFHDNCAGRYKLRKVKSHLYDFHGTNISFSKKLISTH